MTRKSCSGRAAACVLIYVWIAHAYASYVAYVSQASADSTLALQPALESDAETIVLLSNYSLNQEFDEFINNPLRLNRNVTFTSLPGQLPVLDLAMKSGIWQLCSTCMLRFLRVTIANDSSRGTGAMISVVRGQVGSRVEHIDAFGLRTVCTPTQPTLDIINNTQRSLLYPAPGGQQIAETVNVTYEGRTFSNMVHVTDISSDVPLQLVTGGYYVGGYAVNRRNATRLCDHVVSDECIRRQAPEICITQLVDELLGGPAAAAAGSSSRRTAAIAAPVAVGGVLLLATVAALFVVLRRRRNNCHKSQLSQRHLPSSKHDADIVVTAGDGGAGTGTDTYSDRAMAATQLLRASQQHQQQLQQQRAGSETLSHQISTSSGTAAGSAVFSPATIFASAMGSTVMSSGLFSPAAAAAGTAGSGVWEISWCITAPSMEWAAQDAGIKLGPLLGAGSFARVFKAKWAGLDVAVKVIQHDTSTAAVVANEVQLMMQLNHPNIVRAYYCITKQHKQPQLQLDKHQQQAAAPAAAGRVGSGSIGRGSATTPPSNGVVGSAGRLGSSGHSQQHQQLQQQPSQGIVAGQTQTPADTWQLLQQQQLQQLFLQQQQQQQQQPQLQLSVVVPAVSAVLRASTAPTPATPPTPQSGVLLSTGASSMLTRSLQTPAFAAITAASASGLSRLGPTTLSSHGAAVGALPQQLQAPVGGASTAAAAAGQLAALEAAAQKAGVAGTANCSSSKRTEASPRKAASFGGISSQQPAPAAMVGLQRPQLGTARAVYAADGSHSSDASSEFGPRSTSLVRPVLSTIRALYADTRRRMQQSAAAAGAGASTNLEQQQWQQQGAAMVIPGSSGGDDGRRRGSTSSSTSSALPASASLGTARAAYAPGGSSSSTAAGSSLPRQARRHSAPAGAPAPAGVPAARDTPPAAAAAAAAAPAGRLPSVDINTQMASSRRSSFDQTPTQQAVPQWALDAGFTAAAWAPKRAIFRPGTAPLLSQQLGLALPAAAAAAAELQEVPATRVMGPATAGPSRLGNVSSSTGAVSNNVINTVSNTAVVGIEDLDADRPTARGRDQGLGTARALYAPASFVSSSSKSYPAKAAAAAAAGSSAAPRRSPHTTAAAAAGPSGLADIHTTPGSSGSGSTAWPVIQHSALLDSVWTGDGSSDAGGGGDAADRGEVGSLCETWLVTELCDRGALARVAAGWQPQANEEDELRLLLLLQDVARGLKLLHTNNIVHADLNSHNVLVSSSSTAQYGLVAKIADLGLSRVIKQQATHRTTRTVGTLSHQPPELLQDGRSSPAVDIYSFGIMMHELFTGQAAFCGMRYGQIYNQVVLLGARPPVQPDMPDDYQLLMQRCWSADPVQRPSVDMLLDCLALMIQDRQQE